MGVGPLQVHGVGVDHVWARLHADDCRLLDARHEVQEGAQARAQTRAHHQADPVQDLARVLPRRHRPAPRPQRDVPAQDTGISDQCITTSANVKFPLTEDNLQDAYWEGGLFPLKNEA